MSGTRLECANPKQGWHTFAHDYPERRCPERAASAVCGPPDVARESGRIGKHLQRLFPQLGERMAIEVPFDQHCRVECRDDTSSGVLIEVEQGIEAPLAARVSN